MVQGDTDNLICYMDRHIPYQEPRRDRVARNILEEVQHGHSAKKYCLWRLRPGRSHIQRCKCSSCATLHADCHPIQHKCVQTSLDDDLDKEIKS
jgi:hypothetical protein